jgi:putative flippase GtrA
LRFRAPSSFGRYILVGACGVAVNVGMFMLLLDAGKNEYVASPICTALSGLSNLALHRLWSLRRDRAGDAIPIRRSLFNAASLAALGASYAMFVALSVLLPRIPPVLIQLVSIVPAALVNYFGNAYWRSPIVASQAVTSVEWPGGDALPAADRCDDHKAS